MSGRVMHVLPPEPLGEVLGDSSPASSRSALHDDSPKERAVEAPQTPPAWLRRGRGGHPGSTGSLSTAANSPASWEPCKLESLGSYLSSAACSPRGIAAGPGGCRDLGQEPRKVELHQERPLKVADGGQGSDYRSLKDQLQTVNMEDPAAAITVREIKSLVKPYLGNVEETLKAYFENFGAVKHVLVPRTTFKSGSGATKGRGANGKGVRVRWSNVGWVVMETPDAVQSILRLPHHRVQGALVRVEEFRRCGWDGETATCKADDDGPSRLTTDPRTELMQEHAEFDELLYPSHHDPLYFPHHADFMALSPGDCMSPLEYHNLVAWMCAHGC
mmetsp:Transcript_120371/g.236591  ORF Transcript_120371/g.236591 Transcript_120371/m.236591 type:complete len:331 (-) Transcript_120371:251-1243(-)